MHVVGMLTYHYPIKDVRAAGGSKQHPGWLTGGWNGCDHALVIAEMADGEVGLEYAGLDDHGHPARVGDALLLAPLVGYLHGPHHVA